MENRGLLLRLIGTGLSGVEIPVIRIEDTGMTTELEDLALWCDARSFRPLQHHPVRWLDWERDFELAVGLDDSVTQESWLSTRDKGFRYCAVVEGDRALARAAVWTYSESRWEVAAVRTREECRGRGMAKSLVSFVTARILAEVRVPTLHTQPTNLAMLRVAKAVGFQVVDMASDRGVSPPSRCVDE